MSTKSDRPSVYKLLDDYVGKASDTPKSDRSRQKDGAAVRNLLRYTGIEAIERLTTEQVAEWVNRRGLSFLTRDQYRTAIYDFLDWAQRHGLVRDNAAEPLRRVEELVQAHLHDAPKSQSEHTLRNRGVALRSFWQYVGPIAVDEVTSEDIVTWVESRNVSSVTASQYRAILREFLNWACREGLVADNVAESLRMTTPGGWRPPDGLSRPPTGTIPVVSQAVDLFIWDRYGRREVTLTSARHLHQRLALLVSAVGPDLPVDQLDRPRILDWQHSINSYAQASRRVYLSAVRTFCNWAVAEGYLVKDPTSGLAKVREPRRVHRALPKASIRQLLAACESDRDRVIIWLQLGVGLRCGEVASLDLADYDADRRQLFVKGKGGHERILPVPKTLHQAIDTYLASERGWKPGPLIMPVGRVHPGTEQLDAQAIVSRTGRLVRKAGIKQAPRDGVSAHALRHTCASDVLDHCSNVRVVQEILGHADLSTTAIYLRRANLAQMAEALEGRDYT
ncbi:MAG TPA: tyrosine-type recombinase/integrase [Acidimicrobiales bacterium]|nr:tyrosine-type recombinase/integrase [Acidimicrobiales bacterium]